MQQEVKNSLIQMRRTAAGYQNQVEKFRQLIDKTGKDVEAADKMWQGEARDAFVHEMTERLEALKEALEGLQETLASLNAVYEGYYACEQNVSELIKSINV